MVLWLFLPELSLSGLFLPVRSVPAVGTLVLSVSCTSVTDIASKFKMALGTSFSLISFKIRARNYRSDKINRYIEVSES